MLCSRLSWLATLLLLPITAAHAAAEHGFSSVEKVSVVSQNPFQLHIDTTATAAPKVQMVAAPDRLVIDLPNAMPGARLHRLTVNSGAVRSVRTGLYSTQPPVTRIVVDLTLPQWYRIVPDASGVLLTVGGGPDAPTDSGATIGWVSTKSPLRAANSSTKPATVINRVAPLAPSSAPVNGVSVEFAQGMLAVHANNATLSEVLFQIQKKTGAEIAIPSGTEQERVAADFGPASASEVLGQLLNGSGLNFVVVGSEADPNALRSVILSRKGPDGPSFQAPAYPPPAAQNVEPENQDPAAEIPQPAPGGNPPQVPPSNM
jgi:hypothetical protein